MGPNEMTNKTNPILSRILERYVNAESVGAESVGGSAHPEPGVKNETDWYNMTCPRCPWFVDGEQTGQAYDYTYVSDDTDAAVGDVCGDTAGNYGGAPDNAPVVRKDADGDSGRTPGDSGRVADDDTPWDAEWDELLDGVDAKCGNSGDIMGLDDARRVPIVRCERPETQECPGESFCVRLMVAGDLIREQAALEEDALGDAGMLADMQELIASRDGGDASASGAGKKLTKRARRSLNLRRASKKRGR